MRGRALEVDTAVSRIVIVGGGTAGWLAACRIAAAANADARPRIVVTLIESPDVATIGVGEGTWPTMRATLQAIGISEVEFLLACDASFKQGSRFVGWGTGSLEETYLHPFTPPVDAAPRELVACWGQQIPPRPFADTVTAQTRAARLQLAPRQQGMPEYAGALNYAYHLDAAKLAALLTRHGTERLGVRHVRDHVVSVARDERGDLSAVRTRGAGEVGGDLFIDCTGHAALLIGSELGVPFHDRSNLLFNNCALAVQVPVANDSPISSQTDATAHAAGWIWDIGLPTRRGIGCVYSDRHTSDDEAGETLLAYIARTVPGADLKALTPRRLVFRSGFRERLWVRNCLALGLAAGFLEPLEASAIVMIELSLDALLDGFPATRDAMAAHAIRFNDLFRYRWDRVIDFLKLHYLLSRRDERYWRDHREAASVPPRLAELVALWKDQPPSRRDFPQVDEVFPAASYQYVLYGMNFPVPAAGPLRLASAMPAFHQIEQRGRALAASLPTNRDYLDAIVAAAPSSMVHSL